MEHTSDTMLAAMTVTSLSRRVCAFAGSAMISRKRRSNMRGPPTATGAIRGDSFLPCAQGRMARWGENDPFALSRGIQLVSGMERAHGEFHIFFRDQNADLDLRGRDHLNID